jgi:hypothetical protein
MSERTLAATATVTDADRVFDLLDDFTQAIFADPSLLDDIPDGATLVLLPDDDPDFIERSIARGIAAIRQGRDVYFKHVRAATSAGPSAR